MVCGGDRSILAAAVVNVVLTALLLHFTYRHTARLHALHNDVDVHIVLLFFNF